MAITKRMGGSMEAGGKASPYTSYGGKPTTPIMKKAPVVKAAPKKAVKKAEFNPAKFERAKKSVFGMKK